MPASGNTPGPVSLPTVTSVVPTPLPPPEQVLQRYEDEVSPLAEDIRAARSSPSALFPPVADLQIVLVPLSDRLYYFQSLLFPAWTPPDSSAASDRVYVAYTYERGTPLSWEVGVGFETTVDTQELATEVLLAVEVGEEFCLLEGSEGVGGAESDDPADLVLRAVEPLQALGERGVEVEGALEAVLGYATGLDWDGSLDLPLRLALLEQALESPYWGDRVQAADTLGGMGLDAVSALVEALGDEDVEVRKTAAIALGRVGWNAAEAVPSLVQMLGDEEAEVRRAAALALGRIEAGGDVVSALVLALADGEEIVRLAAAQALGQLGPLAMEAAPALALVLEDEEEDEEVRVAAANALGAIGPDAEEGVSALAEALKDESSPVREAAAWALGDIGPGATDAVPALIEVVESEAEEQRVREAAVRALGRVRPRADDVVSVLVRLLEDEGEDWVIRGLAAEGLGRIGPEAMEAVPALIAALGAESDDVRGAAARALRSITGQDYGSDATRWQEWWEEQ